MVDRKQVRNRMRRLQTRHFDEAIYAIKRREKGLEPNTVQYSARTIGVLVQHSAPKLGAQAIGPGNTWQTRETQHLTEKKVRILE